MFDFERNVLFMECNSTKNCIQAMQKAAAAAFFFFLLSIEK